MLRRYPFNPILYPDPREEFGDYAVLNPGVVRKGKKYVMIYRAITLIQGTDGRIYNISSLGYAESKDGIKFENRRFFLGPEHSYEAFGTEDPRISKLKGKYLVTYTAVSRMPPRPENVKLALAITEDFEDYEKFGIICPINSKAGAFFPRKVNDKYAMIITLYPDIPPARILIVYFDKLKDLRDPEFWKDVLKYPEVEENVVLKGESENPFVEVGSPPLETEEGWLLFIPDIIYKNGNFYAFRISAMLLDLENPTKIVAITKKPLLIPEVDYEKMGPSPPTTDIAFPSSAIVKDDYIYVYYGASDRFICLAYAEYEKLISYLVKECRV